MKQLNQAQTQSLRKMLSNTVAQLDIQINSLKIIKGNAWLMSDKDTELGRQAFDYYSFIRKELKLAKSRKARVVSLIKVLK
jgi:ABC-type transporter lipoprotein component MlaA